MNAPSRDQLPQRARQHLGAGRSRLIYNPYSTATWRIASASGEACYLKAAFVGTYPSLTAERDRCMWLREWAPVPEVVDHGADNGVEWMLTAALPGVNATAPKHLADPEVTVPLLADGLRSFHDIDPAASPFDYRMPVARDHVARRIAAGAVAIEASMTSTAASTRVRPSRVSMSSTSRSAGWSCVTVTTRHPTCSSTAAGSPAISTSVRSALPTAGAIWRSRPGA
jgi:aminoglycoside phosphotransferase